MDELSLAVSHGGWWLTQDVEEELHAMKGIRDGAMSEGSRGSEAKSRDVAVSSRRDALHVLRNSVLSACPALLLLTGESGAGKTWLWRRLIGELQSSWRCQTVELTDGLQPLEFLTLLGRGLVETGPDRPSGSRLGLAQALSDERRDGRSWLLVLENAQSASPSVWNELRALIHDMEAGDGFSALLIVGPTALARQLAGREWNAVASRLSAHVHLLPLDLDECRELAQQVAPETLDQATLERFHRDAAGNPRRLTQILRRRRGLATGPSRHSEPSPQPFRPASLAVTGDVATAGVKSPAALASDLPIASSLPNDSPRVMTAPGSPAALLPSKPPLRVEEGLVEVGWEGSLEADASEFAEETEVPPRHLQSEPQQVDPRGEEMIEDHYAALQAWNEWALNRGRSSDEPMMGAKGSSGSENADLHGAFEEDEPSSQTGARAIPGLRAEPQHEHAPYSQLFSRLRQSS
jgi:general secretion pathway protein A